LGIACLVAAGCSGAAPSRAPRLISPTDGAALETARPAVEWEALPGDNFYIVTVEPVGSGRSATGITRSTRWTTPVALSVGASYEWNVVAGNSGGLGPTSELGTFRIVSDVRPGAPTPDTREWATANGAVINSELVPLHWTTGGPAIDSSATAAILECSGVVWRNFFEVEVWEQGTRLLACTRRTCSDRQTPVSS
jgi:hypothetical protein